MVEYHGWFSINESVTGEQEGNIKNIIGLLRSSIDGTMSRNRILVLEPINGQYFLHIAGFTNHKGQDVDGVFDLMKLISDNAKGSYGTLFLRDDEDREGKANEFVVYKMARGEVTVEKDILLSPCNPVIEE